MDENNKNSIQRGEQNNYQGEAQPELQNNAQSVPQPTPSTSPQSSVEALQATSVSRPDTYSTLNQKPLETPGNDLRTQNDETKLNPNLQKHKSRAKIITIVAILVTALILGIGTAVAWLIIEDGSKTTNQPSTETVNPSSPEDNVQVVELALDDGLVRELYEKFEAAKSPWDDKWMFYVDEDVAKGSPSRYLMITLAEQRLLAQDKQQACRGKYEYAYDDGTVIELTSCYAGDDMRQEVREMFGQELDFTEDDVAGMVCGGYHYNVENDEFHEVGNGCGGSMPTSIEGKISKAERKGDELYIYEKVLLAETDGVYKLDRNNEGLMGEFVGVTSIPDYDFTTGSSEEYSKLVRQKTEEYLDNYGDIYKWTFTKTPDGNYVFAGLEKLE